MEKMWCRAMRGFEGDAKDPKWPRAFPIHLYAPHLNDMPPMQAFDTRRKLHQQLEVEESKGEPGEPKIRTSEFLLAIRDWFTV